MGVVPDGERTAGVDGRRHKAEGVERDKLRVSALAQQTTGANMPPCCHGGEHSAGEARGLLRGGGMNSTEAVGTARSEFLVRCGWRWKRVVVVVVVVW